jgi:hypothetical protein
LSVADLTIERPFLDPLETPVQEQVLLFVKAPQTQHGGGAGECAP